MATDKWRKPGALDRKLEAVEAAKLPAPTEFKNAWATAESLCRLMGQVCNADSDSSKASQLFAFLDGVGALAIRRAMRRRPRSRLRAIDRQVALLESQVIADIRANAERFAKGPNSLG